MSCKYHKRFTYFEGIQKKCVKKGFQINQENVKNIYIYKNFLLGMNELDFSFAYLVAMTTACSENKHRGQASIHMFEEWRH